MTKMLSAVLSLALLLAGASAYAEDAMKPAAQAGMKKESMKKDAMKKEKMAKDGMKKEAMKKEGMAKDEMKK